jgi:segregation and condensation protein B
MEVDLSNYIKALLFSTSDGLSSKQIQSILTRYFEGSQDDWVIKVSQVEEALEAIQAQCAQDQTPWMLSKGPKGYFFVITGEYKELVALLRGIPSPIKLSVSQLETLSLIAYRQPITRTEMEAVRGVSVEGPLAKLLERDLVRVCGRADAPGRPMQYGTTDGFLELTGLASIKDIPACDSMSSNAQWGQWLEQVNE